MRRRTPEHAPGSISWGFRRGLSPVLLRGFLARQPGEALFQVLLLFLGERIEQALGLLLPDLPLARGRARLLPLRVVPGRAALARLVLLLLALRFVVLVL